MSIGSPYMCIKVKTFYAATSLYASLQILQVTEDMGIHIACTV